MLRRGESGPEPGMPGARVGAGARFVCCFWKKPFPIEGIVVKCLVGDGDWESVRVCMKMEK